MFQYAVAILDNISTISKNLINIKLPMTQWFKEKDILLFGYNVIIMRQLEQRAEQAEEKL